LKQPNILGHSKFRWTAQARWQ